MCHIVNFPLEDCDESCMDILTGVLHQFMTSLCSQLSAFSSPSNPLQLPVSHCIFPVILLHPVKSLKCLAGVPACIDAIKNSIYSRPFLSYPLFFYILTKIFINFIYFIFAIYLLFNFCLSTFIHLHQPPRNS